MCAPTQQGGGPIGLASFHPLTQIMLNVFDSPSHSANTTHTRRGAMLQRLQLTNPHCVRSTRGLKPCARPQKKTVQMGTIVAACAFC